jgi:tRNA pseudouridine55 synthase
MGYVKRKYGTKKVGFSGTLDPFATGCLIVATGQYTKLFNYLDKTPKTYRATLWLGASSPTLDIEQVEEIREIEPLDGERIAEALESLRGTLRYLPPRYSAKKIDGKRAYDLAREGKEVALATITSTIYEIELLHYTHPFVHFEATVSEGTYIRSLGKMIAEKLGVTGTLSSLERIREGKFHYDGEKALDPLRYLAIPRNRYLGDEIDLELGRKLSLDAFETQEEGIYLVETTHFFAIIAIEAGSVRYKLNRQEKFQEY